MTQIEQMLSGPWAVRLGWTLVHSLWEIAVAAAIVAALLALLRRRSAEVRYLAACVGLAAMLVPPAVTYSLIPTPPDAVVGTQPDPVEPALWTVATEAAPGPGASSPSPAVGLPGPRPVFVAAETGDAAPADTSAAAAPAPSVSETAGGTASRWVPWLAACWILGVLVLSIRNLGGWFAAWRLRCCGTMPMPEAWLRRFSDLKTRLGVGLPVRLVQSFLVEVPVAVGWLRPVILMPVGILTGFAPQEIEAMLAHELAHVRRFDCLVNLFQTVAETLLFYHPAAWWLSRRIRIEREHCCDAAAVAACGNGPLYARALVSLAGRFAVPRPAMSVRGGRVVARVRRILGLPEHGSPPAAWLAGAAVLISLAITAIALHVAAGPTEASEPADDAILAGAAAQADSAVQAGAGPTDPGSILRLRLTAVAEKEYRRIFTLPLQLELKNTSDLRIAPVVFAQSRLAVEATDGEGKPLRVAEPIELSPWEGRMTANGLPPHAAIQWMMWFDRLQFIDRPAPGSKVRIRFGLHGQASVQSNWVELLMRDSPPTPVDKGEFYDVWTGFMDFVYRERSGGVLRVLHVDRECQAEVAVISGGKDEWLGRHFAVLKLDRLNRLADVLKRQEAWKLRDLKPAAAAPHGPEIEFSYSCSGRLLRCRFPTEQVKEEPALLAIQKEVEDVMAEVVASARAAQLGWTPLSDDGLQCRLRAKKDVWQPGETPAFEADVRNLGMRDLSVARTEVVCEVEVDGNWYRYTGAFSAPYSPLPPGREYDGIGITLGSQWRQKTGNEPISWKPGKHMVRVAFRTLTHEEEHLPPVRAETNPVTITIAGEPAPGDPPGSGNREDRTLTAGGAARVPSAERSVAAALAWLARHQAPDGSWSLDGYRKMCKDQSCGGPANMAAEAGATAMALLPFLAAGQTHDGKGPYQQTIEKGLSWLMQHQREDGDLSAGTSAGKMYCHGLAATALCEACGMTKNDDRQLREKAQRAVNFILAAQNAITGGWRYNPGEEGDTSVLGWQLLALTSAQKAGLNVDPKALERAKRFLQSCAKGKHGGQFSYLPGVQPTPSMTAVGLLCYQHLGAKPSDPSIVEGIEFLKANAPDNRQNPRDLYYWFFGTQVMHNASGPDWDQWNRRIRRTLIEVQGNEGCAAGSWDPEKPTPMTWSQQGGRLMATSLAALTLEVSYQYLPLFKREREPTAGARVTLLLDRQEFLLGENITVCYRLENAGREPLRYEQGGNNRTLRRNDGYAITMTPIDAEGKEIGKPLEPVPEPESDGGRVTRWELKPGEVYQQTLYLPRYVRLDQPGRFRLRIVNRERLPQFNDRGRPSAKEVFSVGETVITLRVPTPQEAREVYERMKKLPQEPVAEIGERRDAAIADFEALIHPVYLPILRERASAGGREALVGLGKMQRAEANAAVIEVIEGALGKDDLDLALAAYHQVCGMPDPRWYPGFYPDANARETPEAAAKRQFVARTWRPQFAATLRRLAGRLARDPKSVGLEEIARIYERVGTAADMPDLAAAYSKSIAATKTLPFETHQYFRPRGSAYSYRFAAHELIKRGAQAARDPQTPGEAAVYLIAMRERKDFRPEDWPKQVVRWLRHETPYMRELVLEYMPQPVPEAALQEIPKLLADDYVDLQIAACHTARKHPRDAFREPLLEILRKGKEEHLLNAATEAAAANGITKDLVMEVWLARMDNSDLGGKALLRLLLSVLDDNRAQSTDKLDPEVQAAAKARWERFIRENREKLRQGHRFKLGDPEITPDLFPRGFQFYFQGKPWPPVQAEANPATVTIAGEPAKDESAAKPWVVTGKVTDPSGNGLPGVTVRANCGWGTLRRTGETVTANDGTYTLRFAPGIRVLDEKTKQWRAGVQAAIVSPSKPGYYEWNLHQQGDLLMADEMPDEKGLKVWSARPDRIVLPNKPDRVDFMMAPAASIQIELVDQQDKPLADTYLRIAGHKLPPASSVLASGRTNTTGKIALGDVPLAYAWWLAVPTPNDSHREVRSSPIAFRTPGQHLVKLRLVQERGGQRRLEILSITDGKNQDERGRLVEEDPAGWLLRLLTDPDKSMEGSGFPDRRGEPFSVTLDLDFNTVIFDKDGKVTSMSLSQPWVGDDLVREFYHLPKLERLSLRGRADISDEGLASLGRVAELTSLRVASRKVTDKGLAHLANLKKLESLYLWSGAITDEGLKTLSRIEGLKELSLSGGSRVTEAGLQHLAGMKQLKSLRISGATLAPDAIDRLKQALPGCKVDVTPLDSATRPD